MNKQDDTRTTGESDRTSDSQMNKPPFARNKQPGTTTKEMEMGRTRFEAGIARRNALREAVAQGKVADNNDVRLALLARVKSGEITLEQSQRELEKIKRGAKANGMKTKAQVWRES